MWHFLALATSLITVINGLCSWDRHADPEQTNGNAATMNFINGEWTLQSNQFKGQKYWKKSQSNCYVPELYLYYWEPNDITSSYHWLIATSLGSTPDSAYVVCQKSPQPTDPTRCNEDWWFAPDGNPTDALHTYTKDQWFYFKPGDCPQVLCNSVEFTSTGSDFYKGTYTRDGTDVDKNQNKYVMTSSLSESGKFYLYFNYLMFKWIVNEEYDMDCQKATDGHLTAVSSVNSWGSSSNIDGEFWYFVPDVSTATRLIMCSGQIPTNAPVSSDATGYPTGSPTEIDYNCDVFPNQPVCQPTAPTISSPTQSPSTPTVSWPTYPTYPTISIMPTVPSKSNEIYCKIYFIVMLFFVVFW